MQEKKNPALGRASWMVAFETEPLVGSVIVGPVRADVRIVCGLRLEMFNISQRPAASHLGIVGCQA